RQYEEINRADAPVLLVVVFGGQRRVFVEHTMMFAQIAFGVMQKIAGKRLDPASYTGGFVRRDAVPVARRFAVEPHLVIGIPAGMADPAAQIARAARDAEAVG